jgi:hypothetical protein
MTNPRLPLSSYANLERARSRREYTRIALESARRAHDDSILSARQDSLTRPVPTYVAVVALTLTVALIITGALIGLI